MRLFEEAQAKSASGNFAAVVVADANLSLPLKVGTQPLRYVATFRRQLFIEQPLRNGKAVTQL
ncbi:hypothetical protein RSP799_18250 [Ralstonia solanacearum]|uniref:Uncharacterized protein n=1 Tax=Ralstonia solanacearum TaxID=305 RepID=A0A0S4TRA8_RALSL|nr:hypothetical protein RSP799_18250 [Ralstonia solanacearum]CUV12077.1 protein of unknown function [Ralstonia solanacearum]